MIRNVPLARALIQIEEAHPIPRELYVGVAEVLKLVGALDKRSPNRSTQPFGARAAKGATGGAVA